LQDFECLVVEDGADPETARVMLEVCAGDARFVHLVLPHSGKPGRTRNAGLYRARGALCAFLDDDDLWLAPKLERQLAVLNAEPSLGLVCTRIEAFGARSGLWPHGVTPAELSFAKLVTGNFVATSSVVARRELLVDLGGFDETLERAQDYDLWLRFARRFKIRFVDEVLCRYRTHSGNISDDRVRSLACVERILRRLYAEQALGASPFYRRLASIQRERASVEGGLKKRAYFRLAALGATIRSRIAGLPGLS